ncbi:HNH endonuclease [Staphylococcus phage ESa2]|nr:HNH endonuclease [Staphylococcus phage ESa2]
MKKIKNIDYYINKKYNRLTIKSVNGEVKGRCSTWLNCQCECGNMKIVRFDYLVNGRIKSCGCYRKDNAIKQSKELETHNLSGTRLFTIHRAMKRRCYDSSIKNYKNYGARGITVCDEWLYSLENFANWAYDNGYNDNLTIDRIDNNGNYEPNNCRWVDNKTQANNKRNNVYIEYKGNRKTISQWSRELNISYGKLYNRIVKKNMTIENILKEFKEKD